jgi:CheY-like chemotaxis protein
MNDMLQGIRILLVEDIKVNQMIATQVLKNWGAEVTIAENGQESLEHLQRDIPPYDLVLMDIQMPVMDGLEATKHIRQDLHLNTPIIALTANASICDRDMCMAAGMNDYLTKPFQPVDLWEKIQAHLSHLIRQENVEAPPVKKL